MKPKDEHIALVAFVVCFIWFYLIPVFGGEKMAYFRYILDMPTIGADLKQMLTYAGQIPANPYIGRNIYPPFASILFIPFTWVDVKTAYLLLTMVTLGAYFGMFSLAPKTNVSTLIFVGGLVGYGMQFEIERGQWNVIAMFLAMVGMELWRRK